MNYFTFALFTALISCSINVFAQAELVILGVAQDAGYPQTMCYQAHCLPAWEKFQDRKLATSIALIDHTTKQKYLFEATPNMPEQLYRLNKIAPDTTYPLKGIFLTHAHIGHYSGLMYLGKESANTKEMPVYAMPKMQSFITNNGPWQQLVSLKNISIKPLTNEKPIILSSQIKVTPFVVPHRDEYSETVGYKIQANQKKVLFIPDIDKWSKWDKNLIDELASVDFALLDGTFFDKNELRNRDITEVPHPLVTETISLLSNLSKKQKTKVYFIHFNHTNTLINQSSDEADKLLKSGFNLTSEGMRIKLL